jgi:exodeoxyribonuclease VII large subunit
MDDLLTGIQAEVMGEDTPVFGVSDVASGLKALLGQLPGGIIEGEVREIKTSPAGHCYLTLADEAASLSAIIWRGRVAACSPLPSPGDLVQARFAKVDLYAPRGSLSLIVTSLRPTGEGEILRRREEVRLRLEAEGLTDPARHLALPAFPRRVGLVAGAGSDARADVIRALREHFPPQDITFMPALVQGVSAPKSVIHALRTLAAHEGVEAIIVARGGGSALDLAPFDDEALCRAIFACPVPVITSIGHTQDRPNCDLVASAFAPVPARAAELAVARSAQELLDGLEHMAHDASGALDARMDSLSALQGSLEGSASRWRVVLHERQEALRTLGASGQSSAQRALGLAGERLSAATRAIEGADWRRRGWALLTDEDGQPIRSAVSLAPGAIVRMSLADGEARARVEGVETHA